MTVSILDIFWLMLGSAAVGGGLIILSALVTGYLVFRAKRETHETLFPARMRKAKGKPIIVDEFEREAAKDDDTGLPDIIGRMNARMAVQVAETANRKEVAQYGF